MSRLIDVMWTVCRALVLAACLVWPAQAAGWKWARYGNHVPELLIVAGVLGVLWLGLDAFGRRRRCRRERR